MDEIGPDRHVAWHVLGAVLRTLRDRLTIEESAHLSAQLPLLVRGLYYDQWQPSACAGEVANAGRVHEACRRRLAGYPAGQPAGRGTGGLHDVLAHHISKGEFDEVAKALPEKIWVFFEQAAATPATVRGAEGSEQRH